MLPKQSPQRSSVRKVFLDILQNSQENTSARVSFFNKGPDLEACNFIKKETLAQVFSCKFCKVFKNTSSSRTPPVAASDASIITTITAIMWVMLF